jgi:hypothetical protein
MSMPSPETLAQAREEKVSQFGSEGSAPKLSPPRRKRWIALVLFLVAGFGGCSAWDSYKKQKNEELDKKERAERQQRLADEAARRKAATPPPVAKTQENPATYKKPDRSQRVLWVDGARQVAAIEIDGVTYEVEPGDVVDGITIGVVGVRGVDLADSSGSRRLSIGVPKIERTGGLGGLSSTGQNIGSGSQIGSPIRGPNVSASQLLGAGGVQSQGSLDRRN